MRKNPTSQLLIFTNWHVSCLALKYTRGLHAWHRSFSSCLVGLFVRLAGFFVFEINFIKLLEMGFFSSHIILGVDKHQDLRNEIYQIIGDALRPCLVLKFFWIWLL